MDSLICPRVDSFLWIFHPDNPSLLYYSHFPALIIALFVSVFLFRRDKTSIQSLLLSLMLFASGMMIFWDLLAWGTNDTRFQTLQWAVQVTLELLVFFSAFYFVYVVGARRDMPFLGKVLLSVAYLIVLMIAPTSFMIEGVEVDEICDGVEGYFAGTISYLIEAVLSLGMIIMGSYFFIKERTAERWQPLFMTLGILLYLGTLTYGNIVGSITGDWEVAAQMGLFGLPIFAAILAYLVTKYGMFNVKLFGAQALVWGLWILTGSLLLLDDFSVIRVVVAITLAIFALMGWSLIRSVRREIEQREELARLQGELKVLNQNLRHTVAEQTVEVRHAYEVERKALADLQALDKAKTQFVLTTQHHLRTPLTVVNGYIQTALGGSFGTLSDTMKASLQKAAQGAETLRRISNELLDVLQFEVGKSILKQKDTTLTEIAEPLAFATSKAARSEGASMSFSFSEEAEKAPLFIDTDRIQEALAAAARLVSRHKAANRISLSTKLVMDPIEQTEQVLFLFEGAKQSLAEAFNEVKSHTQGAQKNPEAVDILLIKNICEAHGGRAWTEIYAEKSALYMVVPLKKEKASQ